MNDDLICDYSEPYSFHILITLKFKPTIDVDKVCLYEEWWRKDNFECRNELSAHLAVRQPDVALLSMLQLFTEF